MCICSYLWLLCAEFGPLGDLLCTCCRTDVNICPSCSNTFLGSRLKEVAEAAFSEISAYWSLEFWVCHPNMQALCSFLSRVLGTLLLSSFGDVTCVLLQSFLLYQLLVHITSLLGSSGKFSRFRWSLFLCICFFNSSDSCHLELTHLAWCTVLFFPWYVVWSLQFSHISDEKGARILSSLFSDLPHHLKDRAWATTRTAN